MKEKKDMEKITAYKANDGKLFVNESDCEAYEKERAKYPKRTFTQEEIAEGIVKKVETIKKSKYAQTIKNVWYEVAGKYIFRNLFRENMFDYPDRVEWIFAKEILDKKEISASFCHHVFSELPYDTKHRNERWGLEEGTIENKIYRFSDVRWHYGAVKPDLIEIEVI